MQGISNKLMHNMADLDKEKSWHVYASSREIIRRKLSFYHMTNSNIYTSSNEEDQLAALENHPGNFSTTKGIFAMLGISIFSFFFFFHSHFTLPKGAEPSAQTHTHHIHTCKMIFIHVR